MSGFLGQYRCLARPPTSIGLYDHRNSVAPFIFAVVGLISAQLLGRTVDAYEVLDDRVSDWVRSTALCLSLSEICCSFASFNRLAQNNPVPALMIGDEGALSMTRGG